MHKGITIPLLAVLLLAIVAASVIYGQSETCRETVGADGALSGTWAEGCSSEAPGRGFARYYTFALTEASDITITLESTDADTYLYLRSGEATSGDSLHENDDYEGSTERSQIQETLDAGTYTAEATTYGEGETGSFTVTISGIPSAPGPTPEPTPGTTPGVAPEPLSRMIERVRPAVVKITNDYDGGQGSGVIFKTEGMNGYIITNYHVVNNTINAGVTVRDTTQYSGTVIGIDEMRDLAVVRICCGEFPAVGFEDSLNLNVGDPVVAIGYPYGNLQPVAAEGPGRVIVPGTATVTQGIVSAFRYNTSRDRELIQTDTPINPGNSGGPLLTTGGEIVGINTWGFEPSDGLGYAVSEATIQEHLPDLLAGASPPTVVEKEPETVFVHMVGPDAGHFHHDPLDGRIGRVSTGIPIRRNVVAGALFTNPYSRQTGDFSYGFALRENSDSTLLFYIHSDGFWDMSRWQAGVGWQTIERGPTGRPFRTEADQLNHLIVMATGDYGMIILNGRIVSNPAGDGLVALGADTGAGLAYIVNGPHRGTEMAGAITHYWELFVDELVVDGTPDAASLQELLNELEREHPIPQSTERDARHVE